MDSDIIWIFIDETYDSIKGQKRFIVTASAFFSSNWKKLHGRTQQIRNQRKRRWTEDLIKLLDEAKGFAVTNYADIPAELLPPGKRDSFGDMKKISREDNIWSQCVAYSVVLVMARLLRYAADFGNGQIFYHQKSLKRDHRKGLGLMIIEKISKLISDRKVVLGYKRAPKITVFEEVCDPKNEDSPSPLQNGIWVPHQLCREFRKFGPPTKNPRIEVHDISVSIKETFDRMKAQQKVETQKQL